MRDAYTKHHIAMAYCDECEKQMPVKNDLLIMHCPPNRLITGHESGYDLCIKCAQKLLIKQQKRHRSGLKRISKSNVNYIQ